MGKCRDRTKKFIRKVNQFATPLLMKAGGNMVLALAKEGGVFALMSGHDKRAISLEHLKAVAKAEGRDMKDGIARALNELLFDGLIVEGIPLDELADVNTRDTDAELA